MKTIKTIIAIFALGSASLFLINKATCDPVPVEMHMHRVGCMTDNIHYSYDIMVPKGADIEEFGAQFCNAIGRMYP